MEQLESPAPVTDIAGAFSEATNTGRLNDKQRNLQTVPSPPRGASTSNSVPTLRFPRPVGNRRLTNWVSTSQPDIMRPSTLPDDTPLDASISDGYEVIGTDGEGQSDSNGPSYDRPASDLGDDVQSLADTDTGTDAYTNDVDTDSSDDDDDDDDEEEADLDYTVDLQDESAIQTDEEDHDINMTMVERSLEHPTELFTPGSDHLSRRPSVSDQDHADTFIGRALSAAGLSRRHTAAAVTTKFSNHAQMNGAEDQSKTSKATKSRQTVFASETFDDTVGFSKRQLLRLRQRDVQERLAHFLLLLSLLLTGVYVSQYMKGYTSPQTGVLTTVPVASVSSIATTSATENLVSTSVPTSTVTRSKTQSHALQTMAPLRSVASISPDSSLHMVKNLCSAAVHGRNEVLLKVPQHFKASWLAKHAVMISISRGARDISSDSTKITAVDDGFIIEVPQEEAHGILDVSIATTRKPRINETFHINFGSFIIVDALDASRQLVKGFAQTIVDTLNGTTTWVEETCSPAFDLISKPASVTDSIVQGFQGATIAALSLPGQLTNYVKHPFPKSRVDQARKELLRTAQDLQDEASLFILQAQLNSKLQWLRWSGQLAKYEQYVAAAGPYYQQKQQEVDIAMRSRAEQTKKDIRARQKQDRREYREGKPGVWLFGGGGS